MAAFKKGRPANLTLEVNTGTRPHSNTIIELETPRRVSVRTRRRPVPPLLALLAVV
ncbi:hypothetical protein EVJ58_g9835 [Rhodofomes roseus]|uniref:Uncharacterized protein n=1 Tax=Rhodofomes roseus TaxID=34475 RepID=A0A4Y9XTL1_9APHY|nr:hypothetical protein EVJ58_g9835 [Rhodofomes roseus]